MRRRHSIRHYRRFAKLAALWVEVFWSCRCDYHNVATYRCRGCGSRAPRALRNLVVVAAFPDLDREPEPKPHRRHAHRPAPPGPDAVPAQQDDREVAAAG